LIESWSKSIQIFARKVLHHNMDDEWIQTELQAIEDVRKAGTHRNIVSILRDGKLPQTGLWFIDMELCDLNLQDFISQSWPPALDNTSPFLGRNISETERMSNVWNIIEQLVSGVAHLHDHNLVHRDIKPQNSKSQSPPSTDNLQVLYSLRDGNWKLGDFGFTMEGFSAVLKMTMYG
jgi:serine/threonine protein kinase